MKKMNRVLLLSLALLMGLQSKINAIVRYVKVTPSGSGNGTSWLNASTDLQAMINVSAPGDEVWIASGTYYPKEDVSGNTNPSDPRQKTFHLPEGVKLYGGFAGTENSIVSRNTSLNVTTLSGDLGNANDATDNTYHVVTSSLPNSGSQGCTIDGLSVKFGNANGGTGYNSGGGICISKGTGVVLRGLHVANNSASGNGGGIYVDQAVIFIIKDSVNSNSAGSGGGIGGGIYSYAANTIVDSCTIYSNTAGTGGGAGFSGGDGTVGHSSIFNNVAFNSVGGGLYINSSFTVYCTSNSIYNNTANNYWGGGIYYEGGNFGILQAWNNCLWGNSAQKGAAIFHNDGTGNYSNNTIVNNSASVEGGGLSKLGGTVHFKNDVFWLNKKNNSSVTSGADLVIGNTTNSSFYNNSFQLATTSYSLGAGAGGNLFNTDPVFINSVQPLGPDNISRTIDDGLALSACSPLINVGVMLNPSLPIDILGNGRVGNYDIGGYEFQGPSQVLVGAIIGDSTICLNSTVAFSNTVAGGTWASSNSSVATVSTTGQVTGIAVGSAVITYSTGTNNCPGTVASRNVTVTAGSTPGPITGADTVCTNKSIQLSNVVPGGVWISNNPSIGMVSNTGMVTGVAGGTISISYTTGGTGCTSTVTRNVVVIASPIVGTIAGDYWVCMYGVPQYTNTTSGGVWTTASNGIRSIISAAGVLTPVSTGIDTVIYTVTNAQGCAQSVIKQINIVGLPAAFNNISGPGTVCSGKTIQLSNAFAGGTWSSGNTVVATVSTQGIVTGHSAGAATIIYTYTNPSYGCTSVTTKVITVTPFSGAGVISGNSFVCMNGNLQLSNTITGGTWSTASGGIKSTVDTSGLVLPVMPGTIDTVRYIISNAAGCTDTAYRIINIGANPVVAGIQGNDTVCANTGVVFINATLNGSWSSGNASIATVDASGIVTGISPGMVTIYYTVTSPIGCTTSVSKSIYVKAAPSVALITGPSAICVNIAVQYSNNTSGGSWHTSSNGIVSSISSSGMLIGNVAGIDTIAYIVTNVGGCTATAKFVVAINAPQLFPITGPDSLCIGSSVNLTHPISGGTWSNFSATTGSVSGSGTYASLNTGIDTVHYQYLSNGCPIQAKKTLIIVRQDTAVIAGATTICKGSVQLLTASVGGGVWSSSNNAVAGVNSNGQVAGVGSGASSIRYTITNSVGCTAVSSHSISVIAPNVSTSKNGPVLTATGGQSNATYQWVDCARNYLPITGASNSVYTAVSNGQYAVVVTYQGCKDTSACIPVSGVSVSTVVGGNGIVVASPANGQLLVTTGSLIPNSIKLFDAQGRLVRSISPDKTEFVINVNDLSSGLYILHVSTKDSKMVVKIAL